jgi:hypothetical protein
MNTNRVVTKRMMRWALSLAGVVIVAAFVYGCKGVTGEQPLPPPPPPNTSPINIFGGAV